MQLDFLRGVAILLVLFGHPVVTADWAGPLRPALAALERFGWSGVDLFFVLSGFLIGGLLFKEAFTTGRIDVRRFLVRRAWKIWPPYFALLAVAIAARGRQTGLWEAIRPYVPNLLHLQNYLGTPMAHTWSLAVEEHFYLLLPALLVLLMKLRRGLAGLRVLPAVAVVVAAGCLVGRLTLDPPWTPLTHLAPTHLRIDGLLFGVLLAYLAQAHPAVVARLASRRRALLVAGLALVSPMLFMRVEHPFVWRFGYTMLYLGYGCIVLALTHTPLGQGLSGRVLGSRPSRAVALIGFYSYSVYLWHVLLAHSPVSELAVARMAHWPAALRGFAATSLYLAAACGGGILMSWLIERPTLMLRDRLWPPRARAEAVLPDAAVRGGFLVTGMRVSPAPPA